MALQTHRIHRPSRSTMQLCRAGAVVAALGLPLLACVDPGAPAPLGSASFSSGIRSASTDFMAPTDGPGSMPGSPGAPMAGTSAGPGGAAPTAGAPASGAGGNTGAGGAPAAGSGGKGGTGAGGAGPGTGGMGTGGTAAGSGGTTGTPPVTASAGTLTIDFTTVGNGGNYAPRNIGAVWVVGPSGKFVKTLERWAAARATYLAKWKSSGVPAWSAFFGIGAPRMRWMQSAAPHLARTWRTISPGIFRTRPEWSCRTERTPSGLS